MTAPAQLFAHNLDAAFRVGERLAQPPAQTKGVAQVTVGPLPEIPSQP